ncbi:ROK family protein [Anaerocolumna sp. MB42-C2]|uniref:ROK family protein n=1 Tax=Anaerocolumna sp. MB42-C2 TaxID=3070997 RepID=UPI0027E18F32|nr:ROK family protein [Anaerocolumna sp. MB42-C2]WMJ87112.1 ROK family protein [Anaerocolumna sp. MB42-C2]
MNKLVLDIGATNTKFALMSTDGKILEREKVPTVYSSVDEYFDNMVGIVTKYSHQADEIAISTNGRMCTDGDTYRAYIMKLLQGINLKKEMELRTGLSVTVLNDGFSAALGEWWKGAGKGTKNLLVIVLGSGMGSGLILNGKLYQGSKLNAAMVFGMINTYGRDKYDMAGITTAFALLLYKLSAIKQIPVEEMTGQRFFDFIEEGDPIAIGMLNQYCQSIAGIVYNSAMLLDLDSIVITGGLSAQGIIIENVNKKLLELPQKIMQGQEVARLLKLANVDASDFQIQVKKGELALDANLYGALYFLLNKE